MEVTELERPTGVPSAVAIGTFDGVHLGHQRLLQRLRAMAAARRLSPTVVTFDPHPASVVRGRSAPKLLTTSMEKFSAIAACGVTRIHVVRFDERCSKESPEEFAERVLVGQVDAHLVAVGDDFRFGRDREGDVERLRDVGRRLGFAVEGVPLHHDGIGSISSTRIRALIADGDVSAAAALLGRNHRVPATALPVRAGRRAALRFAAPSDMALPARGTYLVSAEDGSSPGFTVQVAGDATGGARLLCVHGNDRATPISAPCGTFVPGSSRMLAFLGRVDTGCVDTGHPVGATPTVTDGQVRRPARAR